MSSNQGRTWLEVIAGTFQKSLTGFTVRSNYIYCDKNWGIKGRFRPKIDHSENREKNKRTKNKKLTFSRKNKKPRENRTEARERKPG